MTSEMILYGVFFILASVLFLLFPVNFLKFGNKWRYKNAEPSAISIIIGRIASGIGILIGIALIVMGLTY